MNSRARAFLIRECFAFLERPAFMVELLLVSPWSKLHWALFLVVAALYLPGTRVYFYYMDRYAPPHEERWKEGLSEVWGLPNPEGSQHKLTPTQELTRSGRRAHWISQFCFFLVIFPALPLFLTLVYTSNTTGLSRWVLLALYVLFLHLVVDTGVAMSAYANKVADLVGPEPSKDAI